MSNGILEFEKDDIKKDIIFFDLLDGIPVKYVEINGIKLFFVYEFLSFINKGAYFHYIIHQFELNAIYYRVRGRPGIDTRFVTDWDTLIKIYNCFNDIKIAKYDSLILRENAL